MTSIASSFELVAHAAGRLAGATAMASPATRSAASLRQLSAVWETYLRDAGAGDVGREHQAENSGLFATHDPRRDGVLLWLADHAGPALAESAAVAVRAIGAKQRLGPDALDVLAIALELMPAAPDRLSARSTFEWLWTYVERLRCEPEFAETTGEMVEIAISIARASTYRPATPGACWAANLALAARTPPGLLMIAPGTLSRFLFRLDLDRDEQWQMLAADWLRTLQQTDAALWETDRELRRGAGALAALSKNARGRDAWALIVGSSGLSRTQLSRTLNLSRSGVGVVVRQLMEAGIVFSDKQSVLWPADHGEEASPLLNEGLADAVNEVDQAMVDIDRLLARMPQDCRSDKR